MWTAKIFIQVSFLALVQYAASHEATTIYISGPVEIQHCPNDECPTSKGFFRLPGSQECYISYHNHGHTWPDAVEHCKTEGLQLAEKPKEPTGLRKYIVDNLGIADFGGWGHWMAGRGSGSAIQWHKSGDVLPQTNPLWMKGYPGQFVRTEDCLVMRTTDDGLTVSPDQPYWTGECLGSAHTLCQVIKE